MCRNIRNKNKMIATALSAAMLSLAAAGSASAAAGGPFYAKQEPVVEESRGYWEEHDGAWYYYDANGNTMSGWLEDNESYYYLTENGSMLVNSITPDGHFVDASGRWYPRKTSILNQEFTAPATFPAPYTAWENLPQLSMLRSQIRMVFKERRLKISDNAIEYVTSSNKKEHVLLGIYKLNETGSIRLDIGISLDSSSMEADEPKTYDYMVFHAMMYEITSTPDHLEKAIYSSWEESNSWKISRDAPVWIGDSLVQYEADSGYGHYLISPKQP